MKSLVLVPCDFYQSLALHQINLCSQKSSKCRAHKETQMKGEKNTIQLVIKEPTQVAATTLHLAPTIHLTPTKMRDEFQMSQGYK
jgi:hypothetical protein